MLTYTRDETIKKLILQDMDDQFYLQGILLDGFKGYENYSNAELEEILNFGVDDAYKITVID